MLFHGSYTALLTPFKNDSLDENIYNFNTEGHE